MSKANGQAQRLSAEDLKALKPLTAGDFYWASKHSDKDKDGSADAQDLAFHALHHAAVRVGLAEQDDIYGFLDRIEFNVVAEVVTDLAKELSEDASGPLAEKTGT